MDIRDIVHSRTGAVIAGSTVLVALGGVGGAYAAGQITSADIKDQTIQGRDVAEGAVGTSEARDGSLGMRDMNDFTQELINSKAAQKALEAEVSARKSADAELQAQKADKDHTHSGLLSDLEADGPYPGATNLQEGDNSTAAWKGDGGATRQQSWVSCPEGQIAISGGFGDNDGDDSTLNIVTSAPTQVEDGKIVYDPKGTPEDNPDGAFVPNAWLVEGYNNAEGGEQIVRPWVTCAKIS